MQERLDLVKALTKRAGIEAKSDRLTALVRELPEAQDAVDRAKAVLTAQERLLEERAVILLAAVEGKNEDARKAALLVAKQGDREWQQLLNIVNAARGNQLDAALALGRLKHEWAALTIQVHIFTSTLEFLAGAKEREREGTDHVG